MSHPDDRLRLLSDAERDAMLQDDYDPHEDNLAALAALGRGELGDDSGEAAQADADGPEPLQEAVSESPQGRDAGVREPAEAAQQGPSGYRVDLPPDYDEQVQANKAAMAEVRRRFNDGDLDHGQMEGELDRLQDERDALRDVRTRATVSAEMREQSAQAAWHQTIAAFVDEAARNPALGIVDYHTDRARQADLDAFVRALGAAPGNEDKPMRWFLEEGHRRVVALHGIATTRKPADVQRRPDASGVVTNLADVPGGAGDADPVSDEFAELDKLTGLDYERALGRLSEDKRAQYLRAI